MVRGDDLLAVTGSQIALQRALGLPTPRYAHVPLVLGPAGERLAKRDGAVTLADLADLGVTAADVLRALATTLGLPPPEPADAAALLAGVGPDWRPPPTPVDHATLSAALAGATSRCVSKKCRVSAGRPLVDSGGDAGSPPTRSRGHAPRARQSHCRQPHRRGSDAAPRRLLGHGGSVGRAPATPRRRPPPVPRPRRPPSLRHRPPPPRPTTTAARPTTTAAPTTTVAPTTTLPATTTTMVSPAIVAVGAPEAGFVAVGTDSGSDTARIQQRLLDLGFWLSGADGDYGLTTSQAVMAFQKYIGLDADRPRQRGDRRRAHQRPVPGPRAEPTPARWSRSTRTASCSSSSTTAARCGCSTPRPATGSRTPEPTRTRPARCRPAWRSPATASTRSTASAPRAGGRATSARSTARSTSSAARPCTASNNVPNYPASHGCVRVSLPAMDFIWDAEPACRWTSRSGSTAQRRSAERLHHGHLVRRSAVPAARPATGGRRR